MAEPAHPPSGPTPEEAADRIRDAALALGFARVGFTPVEPFERAREALRGWLAAGRHGEMAYLAGDDRADPAALVAGATTLVVVALAYPRPTDLVPLKAKADPTRSAASDASAAGLRGAVARYAVGRDYHDVMRAKLRALTDRCSDIVGRPVMARHCVDTAPLLEREAGRRAGIGFVAKSTMLIAPGIGTYFVLGELLLDVAVAPSGRLQGSSCGACRACLDACPTGAFVGEHVLDARRCISYLTIELRASIPRDLRAAIGTRVFGCDVCQDVCPFNASPGPRATAPELAPRRDAALIDLVALLDLGSAGYSKLVRGTALRRAHRAQLARNAAVALGNTGDARAIPPLARALAENPSALVRGHAAWALGRLSGPDARRALEIAAASDADASVREEARLALSEVPARGTPESDPMRAERSARRTRPAAPRS